MDREPVVSSSIDSIGYDEATRTLEVEFSGGGVYQYAGVPAQLHERLMSAPSQGRFLAQYIKRGGFSYTQVG